MDHHPLAATLARVRSAGIQLQLAGDGIQLAAASEPDAELLQTLKQHRLDIVVLAKAATDLKLPLLWCADQLGAIDDPAELGYDCVSHFLTLCRERDTFDPTKGNTK